MINSFYSCILLFNTPLSLPPHTGSQCDQHFSILAVQGVHADCQLATTKFQLLYLVVVFTASQYS